VTDEVLTEFGERLPKALPYAAKVPVLSRRSARRCGEPGESPGGTEGLPTQAAHATEARRLGVHEEVHEWN